jgi:NAD(P)-dependent dehydrogenase (short-subunit alcohol dehydrogenase family)
MSLTVVITGAGSGFGKGAALALSARGHHVIATTETEAQATALRAEAPQLQVEKLDITNAADIQKVNGWNVDVQQRWCRTNRPDGRCTHGSRSLSF